MFVRAYRVVVLSTCACFALMGVPGIAGAQTQLPEVVVCGQNRKPKPTAGASARRAGGARSRRPRSSTPRPTPSIKAAAISTRPSAPPPTRSANATIDALPRGTNRRSRKRCLQAPGVSQDSAASGLASRPQRSRQRAIPHQRRDAARRRYRLRQRSRHQLDRQHRADHRRAAGRIRTAHSGPASTSPPAPTFSIIQRHSQLSTAAARAPLTPSFEYGGTFGSNCPSTAPAPGTRALPGCGLFRRRAIFLHRPLSADHRGHRESAAHATSPIHDFSPQEKGFAYMSTFIDPYTRLTLMAGTSTRQFPDSQRARAPVGLTGMRSRSAFGVTTFQFGACSTKTNTRTRNSACWRCKGR